MQPRSAIASPRGVRSRRFEGETVGRMASKQKRPSSVISPCCGPVSIETRSEAAKVTIVRPPKKPNKRALVLASSTTLSFKSWTWSSLTWTDSAGNVVIPEDRIRYAMEIAAFDANELHRELRLALGQAWDDELEPFRHASDFAPVVWLHRVG